VGRGDESCLFCLRSKEIFRLMLSKYSACVKIDSVDLLLGEQVPKYIYRPGFGLAFVLHYRRNEGRLHLTVEIES
jgi:hypothetical protein